MKENKQHEPIEEMLKTLPKVKDKRSREEVYQKIEQQLHTVGDRGTKRNVKQVFPVIVTCIILLSFSPLLLSQLNKSSVEDRGAIEESAYDQKMGLSAVNENKEVQMSNLMNEITIAAINKDDRIIPITLEISNDEKSQIEKIKEAQAIVSEDDQFISTEPIFSSLQLNEDETIATVIIDERNREYYMNRKDEVEQIVQLSLVNTNVETVIFQNDQESNETSATDKVKAEYHFEKMPIYFYQSQTGNDLLVQDGESVATIEEAIQKMKVTPNANYEAMIKADEEIKITTTEEMVSIHFKEPIDLENEHVYFIESLVQLAHTFNYQYVQFENIIQEYWQEYTLDEPIDVVNHKNKS